jgi:prepilin peptidase CpaA
MMLEMLSHICLAVLPIALTIAAISDLFTMKIPNWISLVLVVLFMPVALLAGFDWLQIGLAFLAALIVFGVCFGLFAANVMGGGDAKLLTASALWFGYDPTLFTFLVLVAFAGGLVTILILLIRAKAHLVLALGVPLPHALVTAKKVPYAIAIAIGGFLTFLDAPLAKALMGLAA